MEGISAIKALAFAKAFGGGGSSSKYVMGTFSAESSEAGEIKIVSIPYTGNGYPVSVQIYPKVGAYKSGSSAYTIAQKSAIILFGAAKADTSTAPDWGDDAEKNQATAFAVYKYSDEDNTSYSSTSKKDTRLFTTQNPANTYAVHVVRFYDKNTMKVYIAEPTKYGFLPDIDYTYIVVYSD